MSKFRQYIRRKVRQWFDFPIWEQIHTVETHHLNFVTLKQRKEYDKYFLEQHPDRAKDIIVREITQALAAQMIEEGLVTITNETFQDPYTMDKQVFQVFVHVAKPAHAERTVKRYT